MLQLCRNQTVGLHRSGIDSTWWEMDMLDRERENLFSMWPLYTIAMFNIEHKPDYMYFHYTNKISIGCDRLEALIINVTSDRKLGASVIPHFRVILTRQSISEIIVFIQSDHQGQKVNFNVKWEKISFLTNTARNVICNTFFCGILTKKIKLWHYFVDSRSSSRSILLQDHQKVKGTPWDKNFHFWKFISYEAIYPTDPE